MAGINRIDVEKRDDFFVFVNKIDRNLFSDNFAEEAIHIYEQWTMDNGQFRPEFIEGQNLFIVCCPLYVIRDQRTRWL